MALIPSLQLLSNVISSARIVHCPGDTRRGAWAATSWTGLGSLNVSYSYVPNLVYGSSNVIVALDRISVTSSNSPWPADGNSHRPRFWGWGPADGGNVLFADAHVEYRPRLPADLRDRDGKAVVLSP